MQHHLYADDTQLYVTCPPSKHTRAFDGMEACECEVKIWLCDNGLVLNENKTEAIIIRSPNVRTPITTSRVNICGQLVDISAVIRDLGCVMDAHLSMASQVSNICRTVDKSLIRGIVTSRLDYGNAMLFGIADRLLTRLEMVQRSAARLVMQIRRGDRQSLMTIIRRLHWLPVKKRIEFKKLVLVHKAIYEGQPVYLASLLNQHTSKQCLRSSSGLLLDVTRINLERFGPRAFASAGPTLWNILLNKLRVNGNHTQFKKVSTAAILLFNV